MSGARSAVSILFLVNGFLVGNWVPQIPEFAERLQLDESQVGLMITVFGIGALLCMPLAGVAIARYGAGPVTKLTSAISTTTLFWLIMAPDIGLAAIAIFAFGSFLASMDVAMNATAVEVERKLLVPIMSSCHGFWSLGGLIGSLSGGYLIQTAGSFGQASFCAIAAVLLVILAWRNIASSSSAQIAKQVSGHASLQPIRFPKILLPYLIGLVALFTAMPEGAVIDWSALYMRQELSGDAFISSLAFGAFSATMTIVRFIGDPVRLYLGAVKAVRLFSLVAILGFLISGLSANPALVVIGFAVTGVGLSNLIPIAFSAAGNVPGLAPGIGISLVTTIGYSGMLVAPAMFGYVAEVTGFASMFAAMAFFLVVVFLLAPITRHADFSAD